MAINTNKRIRFIRGNTAANNGFVGFSGEITINTDDWSIRVHDGVTPGGFQVQAPTDFGLDGLSDVDLTGLIDQSLLVYSTSAGKWIARVPDEPIVSLNNLEDVDVTNLLNESVLRYSTTDGKWVATLVAELAPTNHSVLSNLNLDDHPQYLRADGTRALTGPIIHAGLVPTEGPNIDQVITITRALTLQLDWQDTGIVGPDVPTGTYALQLYANDSMAGGNNINEYYSGVLSWYSGPTQSSAITPTDEVPLHRAGGSTTGVEVYLRTFKADQGFLKLQIYSNMANVSSSNYVFRFRRLI